ncbi:MAG TPA: hypothetical protein VIK71_02820 [Flavobacteriales bacterium]
MNKWSAYIDQFANKIRAPYATRLFTILIYVWFLAQAAMIWPYRSLLWGEDAVLLHSPYASSLLNNFFYQLVYVPSRFNVVFGVHIVASAIALFECRWSFIPRIAAWCTAMMLYYSAPQAFNSGILFMSLMAFYSVFVYTKAESSWNIVISNLARLTMVVQVVAIYSLSSWFKLIGEHWVKGDALYYALNIDVYSSQFWQKLSQFPVWCSIITYLTLGYQLLFPLLLLLKKQRHWVLLIGVLFHLMIGIVMHLWDFAFAMIFCYALFMKEEQAKFLMPFRKLRKMA